MYFLQRMLNVNVLCWFGFFVQLVVVLMPVGVVGEGEALDTPASVHSPSVRLLPSVLTRAGDVMATGEAAGGSNFEAHYLQQLPKSHPCPAINADLTDLKNVETI